jgi:tRNA (guanine26-N2/guanine27-N2)-dimethyltransferase
MKYKKVKRTCLKQGYVYQSVRCPSFHIQPVGRLNGHSFGGATGPISGGSCSETGGAFRIGGPIWTEPIHNMEWVNAMKVDVEKYKESIVKGSKGELPFPPTATHERLHGLLTSVSEELPDVPLYYTLPNLCETLHCESPKMNQIKSALINAGLVVVYTYHMIIVLSVFFCPSFNSKK